MKNKLIKFSITIYVVLMMNGCIPTYAVHDFYVPGGRMSKKQKAQVDSLRDSTLMAQLANYKKYRIDYNLSTRQITKAWNSPLVDAEYANKNIVPKYATELGVKTAREYSRNLRMREDSINYLYYDLYRTIKK